MNAMFGMIIFDNYWWLMIPGLLLGLYAQTRLQSTYGRFIQVPSASGLSGAEAARIILDRAGLGAMPIQEVPGQLSDHYDPMKKQLCLSSDVYHGRSLASLGVAAHEAGHALQHQAAYAPLQLRMAMVPLTGFASSAATWIFIGGMIMGLAKLATFAVIVFGIIAAFQVITLPVEYDASARARRKLLEYGLVSGSEERGVGKVLNAAALTYVAAMVGSLMTLLHFILIMQRGDD